MEIQILAFVFGVIAILSAILMKATSEIGLIKKTESRLESLEARMSAYLAKLDSLANQLDYLEIKLQNQKLTVDLVTSKPLKVKTLNKVITNK